jgi:hypothetical protein
VGMCAAPHVNAEASPNRIATKVMVSSSSARI